PDTDFEAAIARDINLGVSSARQLRTIADAAGRLGRVANVHLKLDTGLSRNGLNGPDWAEVFALGSGFERDGLVHVRGIFSHLSNASPAADV
ncbi:alanine racemase, partial [Pseudomonas sp. AB12(2023)]|uniref:alanine racemase n=1 Tax=Pseudomonas sp. AB12(2023) TaxID=3048597 RepID=UPI002B235416